MKLHELARLHNMHPAKLMLLLGQKGAQFEEIWPVVHEKWRDFQPGIAEPHHGFPPMSSLPGSQREFGQAQRRFSANGQNGKDYDLIAFLPEDEDPGN